ncbi:MAG: hypothetical protein ACQET8_04585 [Bacillota bacterium]
MLKNCGCSNHSKCSGCACCVLKELAEKLSTNCDTSVNPSIFLLNKGTRDPIQLTGELQEGSTIFQLLKFDPNSCCAYFSYVDDLGITRTFIIDCRNISVVAIGPPGINNNNNSVSF